MSAAVRRNEVPACGECKESLIGKQYLMQAAKKLCLPCYEILFSNTCKSCKNKISPTEQDISYKDMHFHVNCFTCAGCSKSIANESFIYKEGTFTCGTCYENRFSPKCVKCMKPFKPGIKRMEYDGKAYHEACFCCTGCEKAIGTQSFVKVEEDIFCQTCFESNLAKKCAKCNQIIKSTGVMFDEKNYCSGCFSCGGCGKELAEEQFVTHEGQAYCIVCHEQNFSKLCAKCANPITGIGGSKMMVFEDMQWHFECFQCFSCNLPLEGQGFILHESEVYCSGCMGGE